MNIPKPLLYIHSRKCECCRKIVRGTESRIPTNEKTSQIFRRLTGFTLPEGILCGKCHVHLLTFEVFYNDIFKKHFYINRKSTSYVLPMNLLDQPYTILERCKRIDETLTTKANTIKKFSLDGSVVTKLVPVRAKLTTVRKEEKKAEVQVIEDEAEGSNEEEEEGSYIRVEEVDDEGEIVEKSVAEKFEEKKAEIIASAKAMLKPRNLSLMRASTSTQVSPLRAEPVKAPPVRAEPLKAPVVAIESPFSDVFRVKTEPLDPSDVAAEPAGESVQCLVNPESNEYFTIKTEPMDFDDAAHIPEFMNEADFEMDQNVVIKEEYLIADYTVNVEDYTTNVNDRDEREALLFSFNAQNELVVKDIIKKKIEKKKLAENRRKTVALSIPKNAQIVDELDMKEESAPESKLRKVMLNNQFNIVSSRLYKYKCEHCTVTSRSRFYIVQHIKQMHAFSCTVCLQVYPSHTKLIRHQETAHKMSQCEDGGRRKQKLKAKTEDVPAAFRLRSKN